MNNSKYNILLNDWSLWMSGLSPLYNWNVTGNMTVDGYHGLMLEYNALGKVSRVKSGASAKVSYTYLADGTKVSALDASGNGLLYSGAMVFRKDGSVRSTESVGYSGGRFVADASGVLRPQIHVLDHLGSVRAIVDKSGNDVERDSYYPYGERWNDGSVEQADNRYRYNGKEEQSGFGLPYLDYGARLYDPATGRWLTQDPLAENAYSISPYSFCFNNPLRFYDSNGMWGWDRNGNLIYEEDDNIQTLSSFLGIRNRQSMDILNRAGGLDGSGSITFAAGYAIDKDMLYVDEPLGGGLVIDNTRDALGHYLTGNGESVNIGDRSLEELISSREFQRALSDIRGDKSYENPFSVDMTLKTFHIGRTKVKYGKYSSGASTAIQFIAFYKDGFWDPDFIDERIFRKMSPKFEPDGPGPNLERFNGRPYHYKTRVRTYYIP